MRIYRTLVGMIRRPVCREIGVIHFGTRYLGPHDRTSSRARKGHFRSLKGVHEQKLRRQNAISRPSRATCVKNARSNFFARCSLARNKRHCDVRCTSTSKITLSTYCVCYTVCTAIVIEKDTMGHELIF